MKERKGIDWKTFSAIDPTIFEPERINKDILDDVITMIVECNVEDEFDSSADPNLLKAFKIMQKLMAWLLKRVKSIPMQGNLIKLQAENEKLKRVIQLHEKSFGTSSEEEVSRSFQCSQCPKRFTDELFLKSHVQRRHPSNAMESAGDTPLVRKIAEYNSMIGFNDKLIDQISDDVKNIKTKLEETEAYLMQEQEARLRLEEKLESEVSKKTQFSFSPRTPSPIEDEHPSQSSQASDDPGTKHAIFSLTNSILPSLCTEIRGLRETIASSSNQKPPTQSEPKQVIQNDKGEKVSYPEDTFKIIRKPKFQVDRANTDEFEVDHSSEEGVKKFLDHRMKDLDIDSDLIGLGADKFNSVMKILDKNMDENELEQKKKIMEMLEVDPSEEPKPFRRLTPATRSSRFKRQEEIQIEPKVEEQTKEETPKIVEEPIRTQPEIHLPPEIQAEPEEYEEREIRAPSPIKVPLKSNLSKGKKPFKRKISFAETRIEISPEDSPDEVDFRREDPVTSQEPRGDEPSFFSDSDEENEVINRATPSAPQPPVPQPRSQKTTYL